MKILTQTQQQQLLELAPARTKLILHTLLETGCTSEEITHIKVSDVSTTSIRIQGRETQISKELAQQLKEATGEYVFSTRQSPQMTARRVQQLVKEALKAIDVVGTAHVLRCTNIVQRSTTQDANTIAKELRIEVRRVYEILGEHQDQRRIEQIKRLQEEGL